MLQATVVFVSPIGMSRGLPQKLKAVIAFPYIKIGIMGETLASSALNILHQWVHSESLRKHCYAVADSMKHFAQLRGEDADLWEATGLLHDMDYERHPNLECSPTEGHPFVGFARLRDNSWSEEVCRAFLSYAAFASV